MPGWRSGQCKIMSVLSEFTSYWTESHSCNGIHGILIVPILMHTSSMLYVITIRCCGSSDNALLLLWELANWHIIHNISAAQFNPLTGTLTPLSNGPLSAIRWLLHWPLMSGLFHLVQRGGAWAGCDPAQSPTRCTKFNSPPINGVYRLHIIRCVQIQKHSLLFSCTIICILLKYSLLAAM